MQLLALQEDFRYHLYFPPCQKMLLYMGTDDVGIYSFIDILNKSLYLSRLLLLGKHIIILSVYMILNLVAMRLMITNFTNSILYSIILGN